MKRISNPDVIKETPQREKLTKKRKNGKKTDNKKRRDNDRRSRRRFKGAN